MFYTSDGLRLPYGYCNDRGKVVRYTPEQTIIKQIVWMRELGLSTKRITKALNEAGVKSRSGGSWFETQVLRVLDRYYREND